MPASGDVETWASAGGHAHRVACNDAAVTAPISPWLRPAFRPTGRRAAVLLIMFAHDDVLGTATDLELRSAVPTTAPCGALDLRIHRFADTASWIDRWRTGALRTIAARQLGDLEGLDAASCCYSISVEVDDPPYLTHLQLAWAVARRLAEAGSCAVLDAYACNWLTGPTVASLAPHRPFTIEQEVSIR
jgi:hypothetical protein